MKKVLVSGILMLTTLSGICVPAKPGLMRMTDSTGATVEVYLRGDEHTHYYETVAGNILLRCPGDEFRYAEVSADGGITAGRRYVASQERAAADNTTLKAAFARRRMSKEAATAPGPIASQFPTIGQTRCLVILAEYPDVKFTEAATPEYFNAKINQEGYSDDRTCGSVRDYFNDQSNGLYTPVFDVVGPITMPHERSYYGLSENIDAHVRDACMEADAKFDVDFTRYDSNADGFVDFVAVLFAGHGEAQGGPAESFWPAMKDLSNSVYDMFDGMYLSRAFCSCELANGSGTVLDGIGTFVHEFSHVLGLPDVYDSSLCGGYGMGHYDVMCFGPYNLDGCCPAGYTALDRYTVGWLKPDVLEGQLEDVELEPLSSSNKAYFIVNPANPNEYYTLENRQPDKWDAGLPGHGLVISYVNYVPSMWKKNTVNALKTTPYEHIRIVAADGKWNSNNEEGDVFPGAENQYTEFTDTTEPAAVWQSDKSPLGRPVTNIRQDESGKIIFNFNKTTGGIATAEADTAGAVRGGTGRIIAPDGARVFDICGRETGTERLSPGIYVVATGDRTVKVTVK